MSVSRPTSEGAPRPGACAGRIAQSDPRVISHSTRGMSNSFVVSLSFVFLGVR